MADDGDVSIGGVGGGAQRGGGGGAGEYGDEDFDSVRYGLGVGTADDEAEGAAASASSSDHDSGAQYIRRAFSSLVQMHWRDITTDIRQVAVLEGHSFTRLVLANQLLDWAHGGAVLHVVYLAELLLHRLRLANWDVVVVFFDSLSLPLDDSPQRLAARVLRHHLSSTLSARGLVELHTFSSWWSDEWHHFVGTRHPALVALHIPPDTLRPPSAVTAIAAASAAIDDSDHHSAALDGSSSSSSSSSSSVVPERAATPAAALVEWEVDDSLRLFALHLLISDDIRCISTDWRFNGHLLSSFDLTPRNAAFRPAVAGALVANQARVLELQQASSWPLLPAISTSLASATAREPQWLSHVVAHAKALIAEQTSTPLDRALVDTLFRCFLVHVALARSLALRQRAMSAKAIALGHELGSKVGEFVSTLLAPALETALVSTASNTPAAAAVADCLHSIDLFDGRLFWAVVGSLARRAASGSALVSLEQAFDGSISASWSEWLRDISGNDSAPIDCSPLVALYRASPTECSGKAAANDDHEEQGLVPLDSPFLRELSQDIDSVLETKLAKCTTAFDDGDDDGMLAFKYHRMTDLPSATEDSKPAAGVSSERYQQIQTQRLYTFLQKFAETLKGNGAVDPHTVSARSDAVIVNRSDVDPDAPSPTQSSPSSAAADSSSSSSTATASTASSTAATRGGKKAAGGAKAKAKAGAKEPKAGAKGGGGGGGGGSKAQQASNRKNLIAQQNLERIAKEDMRRVEQSIEAISSIVDVDDRVRRLASNLRSLTSAGKTAPTALVFGYMRLCEWLMDQWMVRRRQEAIEATSASSSRKSNKKSEATIREERARTMESAVNAVRLVFDVVQLYAEHLSHEQAMTLAEHLSTFGFQAAAESLYAWWAQRTEHKHTEAVTIRGVRDARYVIDMPFARFQLLHCGHLMQRSLDSRTDERVSSFQPDAWQRELLDVVDRRQSALVVAPTSSGKTLVSFYAMKKTLDENKQQSKGKRNVRGVVVYVSPTKALVNQVAAEVYQRYGPVVGTYTREYSHNVASCQVLVTVPECLEQMLLDAAWCARLQFCVLDEIHCIQGTSIDDVTTGKPWERVVDLLPCPFVALSATIGNPKALHSWLQERQRRHGREVQLIIHTYRWCDLRLHVYAPPVNDARDKQQRTTFTTTSDTPATPGLKRLHPIACLSAVELREPGRLNTMSLAADECLELYDAMVHVSGSTATTTSTTKTTTTTTTTLGDATDLEAIRALSPERYFGERHCILRVNVFTWEAALKAELARWTTEAPARLEALLLRLAGKAHAPEAVYPANAGFSSEYLVPLLIELNANGMLPAIVFTLSRQKCTQHALALLKALVDRENQERATPEYQKRLAQTLKVAQQLDKKSKRARDKDDSKLKSGQHEKGTGAALGEDADLAPQKSLLLDQRLINDEPDPQYSFTRVNEQSWLDRGYWIDRIRRRVTEPWLTTLIDGLERGVGVHHAGLPRPYRLAVEVLFRSGHLKVVFATSTLALGINMPCRTTVFLDDSPYLTPLLFRQMSGRAGRRGYDDLGHIVTCGVPKHRVHALMTSPLVHLSGSQPVSISLALRVMMARFEAKGAPIPIVRTLDQNLMELVQRPLFAAALEPDNPAEAQRQALLTKLLFRIYVELLVRARVVSTSGEPIQLAGLAGRLQSSEPANVALSHLLKSGVLEQLCRGYADDRDGTARLLLQVLAHVVAPTPVPPQRAHLYVAAASLPSWNSSIAANIATSSTVVLPPVPSNVRAVLDDYNRRTVATAVRCLSAYVAGSPIFSDAASPSYVLPLSHLAVKPEEPAAADGGDGGAGADEAGRDVASWLDASERAQPATLRSPFVALSGRTDDFGSAQELADSSIINLSVEDIPTIELNDVRGVPMVLNAAALDFLRHGKKLHIVHDNGLLESDAWQLMNSWTSVLQVLHECLGLMSPQAGYLNRTLEYLASEFDKRFKRFNS